MFVFDSEILSSPYLLVYWLSLQRMIHPNPDMRPSASELLYQTLFSPIYKTVKDKHELKAAKQKIQLLEQQLQVISKFFSGWKI